MKNLLKLSLIFCLAFFACQNENVGSEDIIEQDVESYDVLTSTTCAVIDADRCYLNQPDSNFWWSVKGTGYYNDDDYFGSQDGHQLTFEEYPDGTAHIGGFTKGYGLECLVEVDVWLKEKKDWDTWFADGGDYKDENADGACAGAVKKDLFYYVIDEERSTITATGDCLEEGTFKVTQRPDSDPSFGKKYGVYVGPGGANWDTTVGANGLSGWGWIFNGAGERAWIMDFNFKIQCTYTGTDCETAFAIGNADDTYICFIDDDAVKTKRWGWNIGPLAEGTIETYDVYAGAGQCDTSKGAYVGTVDVSYVDGDVSVTYNINDGYELRETHVYAGNAKYPTNKKGKVTVAPGQYTIADDLSGDIYVIAHAVVCN